MRRLSSAFIATLLPTVALLAVPSSSSLANTSGPPSSPTNLTATPAGAAKALPAGGWTSSARVRLQFQVQGSGDPLSPQVEIRPYSVPFKGQPNFSSPDITTSSTQSATVRVTGLKNGTRYHWQARVATDGGLTSDWVTFAAPDATQPDFGVDQTPPSRPLISSASNPDQHQWYNTRVVSLQWHSTDQASGIQGYTYVLLRNAHVIPPGSVTPQTGVTVKNLADGTWFLALRAVDRAGNWSPTGTYQLKLDRQAPQLTWLSPRRFTFNPYRGPTTVQFRTNKDASVVLGLYRVGDRKPTQTFSFASLRGGQATTITWSGKDSHGRPVARGFYFFSARAVDRARNVQHANLGGIDVVPQQAFVTPTGQTLYPDGGKRIFVSIARQTLYAYDGVKLQLQTYVTTGNPNLPTPPGSYTIMARYHPFQFISPWPEGSPYYYPPSWSQYAMLFRDGGYFLHDAPWRSNFGPGSNGAGQPGTNYGGTHGCVNIPPGPMLTLWNWSSIGTPVEVVP